MCVQLFLHSVQLASLVQIGSWPFVWAVTAVWENSSALVITVVDPTLGWATSTIQASAYQH